MRKYEINVKGKSYSIKVKDFSTEKAELEIDGESVTVNVSNVEHENSPIKPLTRKSASASKPAAGPAPIKPMVSGSGNAVLAPIPGQIMEVFVKEGDKVNPGQPVLKMEAMKMENVVNASAEGTVAKILVGSGDAVGQGQELILLG